MSDPSPEPQPGPAPDAVPDKDAPNRDEPGEPSSYWTCGQFPADEVAATFTA